MKFFLAICFALLTFSFYGQEKLKGKYKLPWLQGPSAITFKKDSLYTLTIGEGALSCTIKGTYTLKADTIKLHVNNLTKYYVVCAGYYLAYSTLYNKQDTLFVINTETNSKTILYYLKAK